MKSNEFSEQPSAYDLAVNALTEVFYGYNPIGYDKIVKMMAYYFDIDRPDRLTREQRLLALELAESIYITSGTALDKDSFVELAKGLIQLGMELEKDGHGKMAEKSQPNRTSTSR